MKFFFFLLISYTNFLLAQSNERIQALVRQERTPILKLEQVESNTVTYLPSEFAHEHLTTSSYQHLHDATVLKVYYVYTRYKLSPGFDQQALDQKRFRLLNEHFPALITDPLIEWQILEQTGCTHFSEGDQYFHGFVIIHRPLETKESRQEELERIFGFLDSPQELFLAPDPDPILKQLPGNPLPESESSGNTDRDTVAIYAEGELAMFYYFKDEMKNDEEVGNRRIDQWVSVSFTVAEDGTTGSVIFPETYSDGIKNQVENAIIGMPNWIPATKNGEVISSTVNLEIRVSYSPTVKGMYKRDGLKPTFSDEKPRIDLPESEDEFNLMKTDAEITVRTTSMYKGLEVIDKELKMALVMDVTGSMSANVASLVFWMNNQTKQGIPFTSYTFFNDGDDKPTKKKKIGETGGIYLTRNIGEIASLIKQAMENGGGGERPENDIEAILYSQTNDLDCDAFLLIGDNYSEVRDLELLNDVQKPVHVLVVSAPKAVRPDYLLIAKNTGGKLYLNGETIEMSGIEKGAKLILQGIEYKYTGKEFINLGNTNY